MIKKTLVCGAGGFIGSHLVKQLKLQGNWVRGIDLKYPEYSRTDADEFIIGDLRDIEFYREIFDIDFDEVYQLAADMGGAGYIFTGDKDADIMTNSALININTMRLSVIRPPKTIFYSSSACVYPEFNQKNECDPITSEDSAYPAKPDSEYGWEKLFSERLYLSYQRNYNLNIKIARFHNIFGPEGAWNNGKEKAPAAICRKVAEAKDGGYIDIWGDGNQTRSFLYIDDCLAGLKKLMESDCSGPFNIGSEEMISINELAKLIMKIAGKQLFIQHIEGPLGVRGRKSDNNLVKEQLGWEPIITLEQGLINTYSWIQNELES